MASGVQLMVKLRYMSEGRDLRELRGEGAGLRVEGLEVRTMNSCDEMASGDDTL